MSARQEQGGSARAGGWHNRPKGPRVERDLASPIPTRSRVPGPGNRGLLVPAFLVLFSFAAGTQVTLQIFRAFRLADTWAQVRPVPPVLAALFLEAFVPIAVLTAIALLLASRGAPRWAWGISIAGAAAFAGWVGVDLRLVTVTGNHLHDFFRYATDASPLDWAGSSSGTAAPLLAAAAKPALPLVLLGLGAAAAARAVARRTGPQESRFAAAPWLAGLALASALPVALCRSDTHALALLHLNGRLMYRLPFLPSPENGPAGSLGFLSEFNSIALARLELPAARLSGPPVSDVPALPGGPRPHVVVIALESLRSDSIDPRWMPRLSRWAEGGLRLERHASSGNASQLGLFSLLYGLNALRYEPALNSRSPAALPLVLRAAGYRSVLLDDSAIPWQRMQEYLSALNFDEVATDVEGRWPERDGRTIGKIRGLVGGASPPTFAFAYLQSTHFDYSSPPAYQRFQPVSRGGLFSFESLRRAGKEGQAFQEGWRNRYRNVLAFMDDLLGDLVERVDPARTIVVITGDHGESFGEDGLWLHAGRLSDQQTRTPLVLRGPGIARGVITAPTIHADLLPTLLHAVAGRPVTVRGTYGHDLLGPAEPLERRPLLLVNFDSKHLQVRWRGERLHLLFSPRSPRLVSFGLQDSRGAFLPVPESAISPGEWASCVEGELERIGR